MSEKLLLRSSLYIFWQFTYWASGTATIRRHRKSIFHDALRFTVNTHIYELAMYFYKCSRRMQNDKPYMLFVALHSFRLASRSYRKQAQLLLYIQI